MAPTVRQTVRSVAAGGKELATGAFGGALLYLTLFLVAVSAKVLHHLSASHNQAAAATDASHPLASQVDHALGVLLTTRFRSNLISFHLRLALLYLAVGALLGALAAVFLFLARRGARPRFWRLAMASGAVTGGLGLFAYLRLWLTKPALLAQPGTSPQVQWWAAFAARHHGLAVLWFVLLASLLSALAPASLTRLRRALRIVARTPRRRLIGASAVAAFVVLVAAADWAHPGSPDVVNVGPNIIILAADSVRPDHLGLYGYGRETSPNIDRYFASATRFTDAQVPIARTLPSWTSMMTGCGPLRTGIRNMYPLAREPNDGVPTLPAILRENGYATRVISDWSGGFFHRLDLGFDQVDAPPESIREYIAEGIGDYGAILPFADTGVGHSLLPELASARNGADTERVASQTVAALDELAQTERFLLVSFATAPHHPYEPAYPFDLEFTDPSYEGSDQFLRNVDGSTFDRAFARDPAADRRQIVDLYDGAIAEWDASLAPVFDAIDRDGLRDDTIVVLLSDHGEFLFENGTFPTHGDWLDRGPGANRIPLAIRLPGASGPGRAVAGLVRSTDLAPTLLQLVGLPADASAGMEGRSLVPDLLGQPLTTLPLYGETDVWFDPAASARPGERTYPAIDELLEVPPGGDTLVVRSDLLPLTIAAKERMVETDEWKLVYVPLADGARIGAIAGTPAARYELFNRLADADDRKDLAAARPEVVRSLRALLDPTLIADGLTAPPVPTPPAGAVGRLPGAPVRRSLP
jgi:arylsulfatase A-like enzyme